MKGGLEARILKLEQSANAGEIVFVRTYLADGTIKPLNQGQRYAPIVAELPEECATAEEWAKRYAPAAR